MNVLSDYIINTVNRSNKIKYLKYVSDLATPHAPSTFHLPAHPTMAKIITLIAQSNWLHVLYYGNNYADQPRPASSLVHHIYP